MSIPSHASCVFEGTIHTVWQWEQELYDGTTATFERLTRPDSVQVIGALSDERVLLVSDEQPDRGPKLGPAGGRVEAGETAEQAAHREFLEETGYRIGELMPWYTHQPPGKVMLTFHMFVARHLSEKGSTNPDAGERIEERVYEFDDFLELGRGDTLRDLKLRTMLLEALLDKTKKKQLYDLFYG